MVDRGKEVKVADCEAAGHSVSTTVKHKETEISVLCTLNPQLGWIFPPPLNLSENILTDTTLCDSKTQLIILTIITTKRWFMIYHVLNFHHF